MSNGQSLRDWPRPLQRLVHAQGGQLQTKVLGGHKPRGQQSKMRLGCNSLSHLLPQQNTQRLGVSQATHSLTTPVVSVATPSLLTQGLPFSAMPTAYNTGKSAQPG